MDKEASQMRTEEMKIEEMRINTRVCRTFPPQPAAAAATGISAAAPDTCEYPALKVLSGDELAFTNFDDASLA